MPNTDKVTLQSLSAQLTALSAQLGQLEVQVNEIEGKLEHGTVTPAQLTAQETLITSSIKDAKKEVKKELREEIKKAVKPITTNATAIKAIQDNMNGIEKALVNIKIAANQQEQRWRNFTVRFRNFKIPSGSKDQFVVAETLYTTFIKKAFERAKSVDQISKVPHFYEICDVSHFLPTRKKETPPLFSFTFSTRNYLEIFLSRKKDIIDNHNAQHKSQVKITRDYTMTFKRCMSTLHDLTSLDVADHPTTAVESFWLSGTSVRFTLKALPTIKRVIFNPFAATLDEMSADPSPPPDQAAAAGDAGADDEAASSSNE